MRRTSTHAALTAALCAALWATGAAAQIRLDPLFPPTLEVAPPTSEDRALEALGAQILRGEPVGTMPELPELGLATPPVVRDRLSIVRLSQTYRGLPVHGDGAVITLVLRDGVDLVHSYGTVIDPERTFIGLQNPSGVLRARRSMRRLWREAEGETPVRLTRPELVALADAGRMAYRADVWRDVFGRSRQTLATILVDARSGALVGIERTDADVRVLAMRLADQPREMHLLMHDGLPSKALGNSIDFSSPSGVICQPPGWTPARMGDATRLAVVSFEGSNGDDFAHFTAARCAGSGAEAAFLGGNTGAVASLSKQIYAQDVFVKTHRALALLDPMMGSLASHGGAVPYAWDHHPAVADLRHRPPLTLVVDPGEQWVNGASASFDLIRVHEADGAAMDLPLPHPLALHCRTGQGARVDCADPTAQGGPMQDMSFLTITPAAPLHTHTLFHEIGHYYDQFASHGHSDQREIIAQMFALYLMVRIYDLDYRLEGLNEGACELNFLITHSPGVIVHPDCITDLEQVSRQIQIVGDGGYTIQSFTQGFWSLLWGVSCDISAGVLTCDQMEDPSETYPDRWIEALIFALHLGNELTPVEIWDAMALYIGANYPQDAGRLLRVRQLHGLQ